MTDLVERIDGLVHEPTQAHDGGVDLTVAAVHRVSGPGQIDFGGGELDPAQTTTVGTEKRDPDDDYGWWELPGDQYLVEYNETLTPGDGERLVVQPRDELLARGAFHPTLHARELDAIPVSVPDPGIHLKENARISTVVGVH